MPRQLITALILLVVSVAPCLSGEIENFDHWFEGDDIVFTYDLIGDDVSGVWLYGSTDGGETWDMEISALYGDVGVRVWPGDKKSASWDVLSDHPDGLRTKEFKLELLPVEAGEQELPEVTGSTYHVIPLEGVVGKEVTAQMVREALLETMRLDVDVVVLEVNSPGGLISSLFEIHEEIKKFGVNKRSGEWIKRPRVVVYVRHQALSAAAIISLGCPEIYMEPESTIGAALAIKRSSKGVEAVEEKFASAFRGKARAVAEVGGRNSVLADAMTDPKTSLYFLPSDDGGEFFRKKPKGDPTTIVDSKHLMTLTANEAVEYGLAEAIAADYWELGALLGHPGWTRYGDSGHAIYWKHHRWWAELKERSETLRDAMTEGLALLKNTKYSSLYSIEQDLEWACSAAQEMSDMADSHDSRISSTIRRVANPESLKKLLDGCTKAYQKLDAVRRNY